MKKKIEKMPKKATKVTIRAPENGGRAEVVQLEHRGPAGALDTHEAHEGYNTDGEERYDNRRPEPSLSPRMTAKASAPSAAAPTTKPGMSRRAAWGSALSGTVSAARAMITTVAATLNQKIARQVPMPDERPADHRAERQGQAGDGGPGAQRPGPVLAVGVHVTDHGERAGFRRGRADSHHDPATDKHGAVGRQRAEQGTRGEDGQPAEHDLRRPKRSESEPAISIRLANVSA